LMKVKLPFEPSIPAQIAAIAALDDMSHLEATLNENKRQMLRVEKVFKKLNLLYIPSSANFITLILGDESQAEIFTKQFLKSGIILRHLKAFGLPNCVRVTIGKDSEMEVFINKLDSILEYV